MLPVMLVVLALSLHPAELGDDDRLVLVYGLIIFAVLDCGPRRRRLKKLIIAVRQFPGRRWHVCRLASSRCAARGCHAPGRARRHLRATYQEPRSRSPAVRGSSDRRPCSVPLEGHGFDAPPKRSGQVSPANSRHRTAGNSVPVVDSPSTSPPSASRKFQVHFTIVAPARWVCRGVQFADADLDEGRRSRSPGSRGRVRRSRPRQADRAVAEGERDAPASGWG